VNGHPPPPIVPGTSTDADAAHVTMDPTVMLHGQEIVLPRLALERTSARSTGRSFGGIGRRRQAHLRGVMAGFNGRGRQSRRMIGVIRLG